MRETNAELARRGYEAALRGDYDTIRGLLDPAVRWHGGDPHAPGACRNREQAIQFMRQAWGPRGPGELVDVIDAGERVVVIMRLGHAGTGERSTAANVSTFRDGKVVEMVHYPDPGDAIAAVGIES
jgi:ketosteroid isomerase-like protein